MDDGFKREMIISGSVIFGGALLFGLFFAWLSSVLHREAANIVEKRAIVSEWSRSVATLAEFKRVAPDVERYEARIASVLGRKEDLLNFPRAVDTLARVNRVETVFAFQGEAVPAQAEALGYIAFGVQAVGSFADVRSFFESLTGRSGTFLVSLADLDLQRSGTSYRAAVQGRVYFR